MVSSKTAVFLDRDGVINEKAPEPSYVRTWEEFVFLPNAGEAIARVGRCVSLIFVVSNQRGVARGVVRKSDLERMHTRMIEEIERQGGRIDGIYCCFHDKTDDCSCRKPRPGLLLQAALEHDVNLEASWMIGDREADIRAGKSAGCKTIRIKAPTAERLDPWNTEPDATVVDLMEAATLVERSHEPQQMVQLPSCSSRSPSK